jgi:hypothetical protein
MNRTTLTTLGAALFFLCASTGLNAAEASIGERHLSWQKTPSSLALMNRGKVLWKFNHLRDGSEQGCPYFHPLATMAGSVLTDLRPPDHVHHRGLRFAWKKINGREGYWHWPEWTEHLRKTKPDYPHDADGHTDVTAVKVLANEDFSARFELEMRYHPPGEPADVTEKRIIKVSAPGKDGSYQIDWHGIFTGGHKGAALQRTPIPGEEGGKWFGGYAGLQFRVADHDTYTAWTISNSEGASATSQSKKISAETRKSLEPLHGKPARWVNLTLDMADGTTGGVTLMDHPRNLRHPSPWHIAAMPHEFHQAPLFRGPYLLKAGQKLPFRFRILVHPGSLSKEEVEGQWQDFKAQ